MAINSSNISIELAHRLTDVTAKAWADGTMLAQVTPITAHLLNYWFGEARCDQRTLNFHEGQRQAILNVIYLHEVLRSTTVLDHYTKITPDLVDQLDLVQLAQSKYRIPKYAVKMATGTGKTWVMHALILWQMLNALHEAEPSGRYTRNFLIVAPGLIVYERLKDAFCGSMRLGDGTRDFTTNDYCRNQDLFIPEMYRNEVLSFIQNNIVTKEDGIGRKVTGNGIIALTNWHLFENEFDAHGDEASACDAPAIVADLLPLRPGKAAGNDLNTIDGRVLGGTGLDYLASLDDIMVINDEAHHIHELKRNGEVEEVEWQKGLNAIASPKGDRFMQVDFSATPFDTRGSGRNQVKCYFPHIVVDFDLPTAMRMGLVKTLLIDRRQELTDLTNLDFRAKRDARGRAAGLSSGQRVMLRAGLTKLRKLEIDFTEIDERKNPKMLVVCEDTQVSPYVVDFLTGEGLDNSDVLRIDSDAKGNVVEKEWKEVETQLFDIDRHKSPKVIVSVLMLREGFDVNNICVIVPLRASDAPILLEQTIGRGLRLMWREPEYSSIKLEDRKRVLVQHGEPSTYIDMLSIIEHPAFLKFYKDLLNNGLAGIDGGDVASGGSTGDIMRVGLKPDFAQYDMAWPVILREADEELCEAEIDINQLAKFTAFPIDTLRIFLATEGETFISQEITTQTQFGRYKVDANLFTAESYSEYLQKILHIVTQRMDRQRRNGGFPMLQVDGARIVGAIDAYIRTRLFGKPFDPFNGNDWKILLAKDGIVTQHIVKELARAIFSLQESTTTIQAEVHQVAFSTIQVLRMRESCSQPLQKTIYERTPFPSHGGGLEEAFEQFLDKDACVEAFLKISEMQHTFAIINYIRDDGMLAVYHPDFIVRTHDYVYVVETKGNDKINDKNVRLKQKATLQWLKRINALDSESRMNRQWQYLLLGENTYYSLASGGANLQDIAQRCKVSLSEVTGNLFDE